MLKDREHKHVVELFKTAGEDVELCVQKKVGRHVPSTVHNTGDVFKKEGFTATERRRGLLSLAL